MAFLWSDLPRARDQVQTAVMVPAKTRVCYLQGGLVVMAVGLGVAAMQHLVEALAEGCKRACFVRLQVESTRATRATAGSCTGSPCSWGPQIRATSAWSPRCVNVTRVSLARARRTSLTQRCARNPAANIILQLMHVDQHNTCRSWHTAFRVVTPPHRA